MVREMGKIMWKGNDKERKWERVKGKIGKDKWRER